MLAGLYIIYVIARAFFNPKLAPKPPKEEWDIPFKDLVIMLLTSVVHLSTAVSLERERSGKELARWEKLLPTVLAVLSVGLILLVIVAAVLFGWSVMAIVEKLQAPSG